MNTLRVAAIVTVIATTACCAADPEKTLRAWEFNGEGETEGWRANTHLADVAVRNGKLSAKVVNWDPILSIHGIAIEARPWQRIEVRLRSSTGGAAQFFWSETTKGKYGGFSSKKVSKFQVRGDNEWRTYRVWPFWHKAKKIIQLRFDMCGDAQFEVDYIRIVELTGGPPMSDQYAWSFSRRGDAKAWQAGEGLRVAEPGGGKLRLDVSDAKALLIAPPVDLPVSDRFWVTIRMTADRGSRARVLWAGSEDYGLHEKSFAIEGDGKPHTYNVDMRVQGSWRGRIVGLALRPTNVTPAKVEIDSVAINKTPSGPPEISVSYFGLADAVNRVGKPCRVVASLVNRGAVATGISVRLRLSKGVRLTDGKPTLRVPDLEHAVPERAGWSVIAARPIEARASLEVMLDGAAVATASAALRVTRGPKLPSYDYVPPPRPVRAKFDVGTYYFPGWPAPVRWEPIRSVAPIRKPVLGWYDEANPECADWQIKWAVEHGISFFMVDWYWRKGARQLDHWLNNAYMKARYRRYLKFAIMWANHTPAGSHSLEDWREVTQYWIDHYFGMEEYYKIDGRPAVFIWQPRNIRRDLGAGEPTVKLYRLSQEMAHRAGHKGIYFVAMSGHHSRRECDTLKAEGYEAVTSYHGFNLAMQRAADSRYFPFRLVVDTSPELWESKRSMTDLSYIPVADTGWSSRPWHGEKARVIHGRTPALVGELCRRAAAFAERADTPIVALGPWNEWGEGSYIEPCTEYGFEMLGEIRKAFCPPGDWPPNIAPVDVGRGPYDLPMDSALSKSAWGFDEDGDGEGWRPMMGMRDLRVANGVLRVRTTSRDPALHGPVMRLRARDWKGLRIRMRIAGAKGNESSQVFWMTPSHRASGPTSCRVPLRRPGEFHSYVFPLAENPRWQGIIRGIRFDPCSTADVIVEIDEIRFLAR